MVAFKKVVKTAKLSRRDIIRLQIMTHCELQGIILSPAELDCLTYLAEEGEVSLIDFCNQISDKEIFKNPQTVRNTLNKAEKHSLVIKSGKGKKTVTIDPKLQVQTKGNIMLNFNFFSLEPQKS
jgi:hypothetical protein